MRSAGGLEALELLAYDTLIGLTTARSAGDAPITLVGATEEDLAAYDWPLSDATFLSPLTPLPGIDHAASTGTSTREWLSTVVSSVNATAIAVELVIAAPLLVAAELRQRRRETRS